MTIPKHFVVSLILACACGERDAPEPAAPERSEFARRCGYVREVLNKEFSDGLDDQKTDESAGVFWTKWRYEMGQFYRESKRTRAVVRVSKTPSETEGPYTIEVFLEINDNIDDPSSIEKAKWVGRRRDPARAARIRSLVERRGNRE